MTHADVNEQRTCLDCRYWDDAAIPHLFMVGYCRNPKAAWHDLAYWGYHSVCKDYEPSKKRIRADARAMNRRMI